MQHHDASKKQSVELIVRNPMKTRTMTPEFLNHFGRDYLPGHLGVIVTDISPGMVTAQFQVKTCLMAPNGYLHAGSVVSLADTCAGYGCYTNLPEGATGFTTIELKSNHMGTAREGTVECVANAVHLGNTTQVWDATVANEASEKPIAVFRCTQMILYAK